LGGSRVVVARPNLRGFRGLTFDGFGALLEGGPYRLPSVFERLFRERGGPVDPMAAEAWRRAVQKQFAAKSFVAFRDLHRNAFRYLGLPAENILHVGDSFEEDVVGASAVGMGSLLIQRSGRSKDPVPKGTKVVRNLGEVRDFVRRSWE